MYLIHISRSLLFERLQGTLRSVWMAPALNVCSLPPEIWAAIFGLACLDDGETSLSLSQVSRTVRSLSESQRYVTIKINSIPQLFKLHDVLTSKGLLDASDQQHPLRTRFLCIVLPESTMDQAYPADSYVPEDDPEDETYRGCRLSAEDGPDGRMCMRRKASSESESDEYDSEDAEFEYMTNSDEGEIQAEMADLQSESLLHENDSYKLTIGHLSELQNIQTASSQLEYRIYSAISQLLKACSASLEGFTLWIYPKCLIPLGMWIPQLPNLTKLGIGIHEASCDLESSADADIAPTPLFPVLSRLRLLNKQALPRNTAWWSDVIKHTIDGRVLINLVTTLPKSLSVHYDRH